jgi:hypothetical protein
MKTIVVKDVTPSEAERMIMEYLKGHPGPHFASDLATLLGLELKLTFLTIDRLLEEGRIKKSKRQATKAGGERKLLGKYVSKIYSARKTK